jgi:hypothetical protein
MMLPCFPDHDAGILEATTVGSDIIDPDFGGSKVPSLAELDDFETILQAKPDTIKLIAAAAAGLPNIVFPTPAPGLQPDQPTAYVIMLPVPVSQVCDALYRGIDAYGRQR